MNFGYLIIVSSHDEIDYLKLAYALALSIKNTQKQGFDKVALVIDNVKQIEKLKSPWVFDKIIEWKEKTFWDGRTYMNDLSPWEYTICLDADMLFLRDYSHWAEYFIKNEDLYIANKSFTYRGEIVTSDYYRKAFTENELPNLYSFYTYFKKDTRITKIFFETAKMIVENQQEFNNYFLAKYKAKLLGTDEIFALSAKILGISDRISYPLDFPKIVHMKPMIQNFPWPCEKWSDHLGFYFNRDCELKIGNFRQDDIFHYVEKDKITDEVISILEKKLWKN